MISEKTSILNNINESENSDKNITLTYSFNSSEIEILAKYFRDNQSSLPKGIERFYNALEKSIYNSMSLEEVRKFYS